jgi:hypothetical protein
MKLTTSSIIFLVLVATICSCKNSPSANIVGEYEGEYSRDTIEIGTATTTVVDVNSITVNMVIDLEHDPDFNLSDVQVNGEDVSYILEYNGTKGVLTGWVLENHMSWTLMSSTDTISFNGDKK